MRISFTVLTAACLLLAPVLRAQQPGSIRGTVLDAADGSPIAAASVTIVPRDGNGAFPPSAGSSVMANGRRVTTDSAGSYHFPGIAEGEYRLYVSRAGYAPASVDVRLAPSAEAQLSVGLEVRPVRLAAVTVDATAPGTSSRDRGTPTPGGERVATARERQGRFLGDARELTRDDMTEAVTLGNGDVLRALQRLPGVTTYDEWSARAVVRGSRWDHTRFYFDDIPLLIPLLGLGTATAVNPSVVGSVMLHPGVRPVSLGGEGVSRIDLRSRSAGGTGRMRGSAEIGSNLASISAEQRVGTGGWNLAARHSVLDAFPSSFHVFTEGALAHSSHAELVGRADVPIGASMLEASAITSRDAQRPLWLDEEGTLQQWKTDGVRLRLRSRLGDLDATYSIMGVTFDMHQQLPLSPGQGYGESRALATAYSSLRQRVTSSEIGMPLDSSGRRWAVGYGYTEQDAAFEGARTHLVPGELAVSRESRDQDLAYLSLWAERRWRASGRLHVETGLRVDGFTRGRSGMRAAPVMQARYTVAPATLVTAGAGRSLQYTQDLPLTARSSGTSFLPGSVAGSGGDIPPLVADHANAGVEHWHAGGVLVSAALWGRRASGLLMADPTPGELVNRPMYVTARERAAGVDLSVRKLAGRVTGMVAYGLTHARTEFAGLDFASAGARRHALDMTAMMHLRSWRVGSAYTIASGAPYTRMVPGEIDAGGTAFTVVPRLGEPGAMTLPHYSTVDILAERRGRIRAMRITSFAQLQNILGRNNAMYYVSPFDCERSGPRFDPYQCRDGDLLHAPVGRSGSFGFRLWF